MTNKKNNFPKLPLVTTEEQRSELFANAYNAVSSVYTSLANMPKDNPAIHTLMEIAAKASDCMQNLEYLREALDDLSEAEKYQTFMKEKDAN